MAELASATLLTLFKTKQKMQYTHSYIHNKIHWLTLMPVLLFVLVSCSSSDAEDIPETPSLSDIPVSFQVASKWDNESSSRVTENGNAVSFESGDAIGVFAYYNKENGTQSTAPNFMNNQKVTCNVQDNTTSWTYSPVKYWPNNPQDNISFYAYYPYRSSSDKDKLSVSYSSDAPLSIEYNCPNADIDLMVAKAPEQKSSTASVPLKFEHLLARVKFTFTYKGDKYHPVIHVLKYTIPYYKRTLKPYVYNQESVTFSINRTSEIESSDTVQIVRYVTDVAGTVLNGEAQPIDEFTAYLLPCEFPYSKEGTDKVGSFYISLNNKLYAYTPESRISVEAGMSYTVNFNVEKNKEDNGGNYFITSYSIWKDGGTLIGTLQ